MTLQFAPLLPWPVIAGLAVLALIVAGGAAWRGLRGWAWRGLAGLAVAAALTGPALETATRAGLTDIVVLIDDRSASQSLPGRAAQTDRAIIDLTARIAALPDTELRRVTVGDDPDGTALGAALAQAVAAEPGNRLAGVIAVTDGRLHDAALLPDDLPAPLHVLLTGQPGDWDRRLVIEQAPAFGLIDQETTLTLRIDDQGAAPPASTTNLRISVDGEDAQVFAVPLNTPLTLPITLRHAGQNVIHLAVDPVAGELTDRNNAAVLNINGVRDRLRVLLVSGVPHAGERTWRNLLKSDAAVDLIHFTILRPPGKQDAVPVTELALIAFPTRELFQDRIHDFDLIILDRYRVQGILPPDYYDNIARYVEQGGAVLIAGGPEMAGVGGLHLSPLGRIMPARPTGRVIDAPFLPMLTDAGQRHPVTAGMTGDWGRWLRMVETVAEPGAQVAMTGADDAPLLILNRVEAGRVAMLASDQVWLWGRGFEGGGPQLDLLRRIAHWSMKEPELEEETLLADATDLRVRFTRRTMQGDAGPLTITAPDGSVQELALTPAGPGRWVADWAAPEPGLYRLRDGDVTRVLALGPAAPREFEQTVADADGLVPLVTASGGAVHRLSDGVPDLRAVSAGRATHGRGWIGVTPRDAATVTGLERTPLLPGWAWLAVIAALILTAWLSEGRRPPRLPTRNPI
ncbi:glutamine amidotransferase [Paracoccus sp. (in: a-proteobacteria)]|uniref:glutamine amidotransferase n=1 Tax=Paracoccus sp. TaxID=267 RepID=UPI0026DF3626|nr:glutamine amidotransferase [Paracoccus sp. (in: a-proteobacteria)]MDO5647402.1 glutamine amidotransferase [Paracoccus sp. (in: a-proteobacteria)]